MVQFGRHIDVFVEHENSGTGLFVVPYNDVKASFEDEDDLLAGMDQISLSFEEQWREQLKRAVEDFERVINEFWSTIFSQLESNEAARGVLPGVAISLYVQCAGTQMAREALVRLKQIYEAAYHNTEALRKLVKKFDKQSNQNTLSHTLLPAVYSANFTLGQPTLEEGIALLRDLLAANQTTVIDNEDFGGSISGEDSVGYDSDKSNAIVSDRQAELDWLVRLTESMEDTELARLVAHRGFHSINDHIHRRPNENSLAAYETAWTHGVYLCECDIALTKDEKLVLAHDEDFSRLALNKNSPHSKTKVQDLTFKELLTLTLTSASRPPLLIDVLRSAFEIGDNAKLVIEIKPGNEAAATALAHLLEQSPELLSCVAVIMSFDAWTMHKLRIELASIFVGTMSSGSAIDPVPSPHPLGHHRRRSSRVSFSSGLLLSASPSATLLSASPAVMGRKQFGSSADLNNFSLGLPISASARSLGKIEIEDTVKSTSACSGNIKFPKLMLLTVSDTPSKPCYLQVGVDDFSPVDSWLSSDDGTLDGVYLQYQSAMLEPQGIAAMKELSRKFSVGIWTHSGIDPDDFSTFQRLIHECNVTFVNTDLPENFRTGIAAKRLSRNKALSGGSSHSGV